MKCHKIFCTLIVFSGCIFLFWRSANAQENGYGLQLTNFLYQNDQGLMVNSTISRLELYPGSNFSYFFQGLFDFISITPPHSISEGDVHNHDDHDHGAGTAQMDAVTSASSRVSGSGSSREGRFAGTVGLSSIGNGLTVTPQVGFSIEPDYQSFSGGVQSQYSFNQKNTVLLGRAYYGLDISNPESAPPGQAGLWPGIQHRWTGGLSLSQVLSRRTLGEVGMDVTFQTGTLESPYRNALVVTTLFPERLPDERLRANPYIHLSQYIGFESALHVRFGALWDGWGVQGFYPETKWTKEWGRSLLSHVSYRYYRQYRAADFYSALFTEREMLMSSDVRLSRMTDHSLSIGIGWVTSDWHAVFPALRLEYQGSITESSTRVWGHYMGLTLEWGI